MGKTQKFEFKFAIGDEVSHRLRPDTTKGIVIYRKMIEFACGVEIVYALRVHGNEGGIEANLMEFQEMELLPYKGEK